MFRSAAIALTLCLLGFTAESSVLTFDDLDPPEIPVPNGYGGFTWTNMDYLTGSDIGTSGFQYAVVSQGNVAYNSREKTAVISGLVFDFIGAYFTAGWRDGLSVTVKGFNGVNLLYDTTFIVDPTGPIWEQLDYIGVDKVELSSSGGVPHWGPTGYHFALDNFTYSVVPLPPTVWLLGTAVAGLCGRRLMRRKVTQKHDV